MKKKVKNVNTCLYQVLCIFFISCFMLSCNDKDEEVILTGEVRKIKDLVLEGSLLLDVKDSGVDKEFVFETETIVIPENRIGSLEINKKAWNTALVLDGNKMDIPTLGGSFKPEKIKLNPSGYAPLTVRVNYFLMVEGKLQMRIQSKDKEVPDITYQFWNYGYNHQIDVHGLYPDYLNTVYITLTDKNGKERLTDTLKIQTEDISKITNYISVNPVKLDIAKMEPALALVNSSNQSILPHYSYMIDAMGNIRWILSTYNHPELMKLTNTGNGFRRSKTGNFLAGSRENSMIYEISMLGEIVNKWDIGALGVGFHHDLIEMPNGNILFASTKFGDTKSNGEPASLDYFVELDRETGKIVTEWDLKKSLDEKRTLIKVPGQGDSNWAHGNSVVYLENEDAILVSLRYQGVVKLDRNNRVKWILAPHKGFSSNGRGESLKAFLLNPLDSNGSMINDENVIDGNTASDTFDWSWSQHSSLIMPNGNLLVFDNGFFRNFENNDNNYSRVVEYKIDEQKNTVQQIWQYGKDRPELYTMIGGSCVYLPKTGNILLAGGSNLRNSNGRGGRIIEIDPATNEVVWEIEINEPDGNAFHYVSSITLYP
ncbi:MAG TPA: hypothetical protein DIT04_13060 [Dysgonomonas sp.]|nr:hypothetical protein [Dysgonomonas sp.]